MDRYHCDDRCLGVRCRPPARLCGRLTERALAALPATALLLGLLLGPGPVAAEAADQRQMVTVGGEFEQDLVVTAKVFGTHGPGFDLATIALQGRWLVEGLDARDTGTGGLNIRRQFTQVYPAERLRVEFEITALETSLVDPGDRGSGPGTYNTGTENYAEVTITSVQLRPIEEYDPWFEILQGHDEFDVALSQSDRGITAQVTFPADPQEMPLVGSHHPQKIWLEVYGDHRHYVDGAVDLAHDNLLLGQFVLMEIIVRFDSPDPPPGPQAAPQTEVDALPSESPGQVAAVDPDDDGEGRSLPALVLGGLAVVIGGAAVAVLAKTLGRGGGAKTAAPPESQAQPTQLETPDDGVERITYPDGTERVVYPDGEVETYYPDGRAVRQEPDGTVTERDLEGAYTVRNPDGSVETHYPDGSAVSHHPDGTISERRADGIERVESPDGTYTQFYPDGRFEYSEPDGMYRVFAPDGSLVRVGCIDGTVTVDVHADGTATLTSEYGGEVRFDPSRGTLFDSLIEGTIHLDDQGSTFGRTGDVIRLELGDGSSVYEENLSDHTMRIKTPEEEVLLNTRTGELDVRFENGSYAREDGQGGWAFHDAEHGLTLEPGDAPGSVVVTNRAGQVLELGPDGALRHTTEDGVEITLGTDGTANLVNPEGERAVLHPDGSLTMTQPDGTVTHYDANGMPTDPNPTGSID